MRVTISIPDELFDAAMKAVGAPHEVAIAYLAILGAAKLSDPPKTHEEFEARQRALAIARAMA